MKRVLAVVCDGHRDDFVGPSVCPTLWSLADSGTRFTDHRAVFPSATRVSAASFATGCWPRRHGLHGNTMVLDSGDGPALHDVGPPGFRDAMRAALGRTLRVPTTSEAVVAATGEPGDALVVSNVSPGAAVFHDPDCRAHVYHRAIATGPGGVLPDNPLAGVTNDADGDAACTAFFVREVERRTVRYGVLWLCEPDTSMHRCVLGSPAHGAAIAAADARVAEVRALAARLRAAGDDVLLIVCSDHGQQTVRRAVPVGHLLVEAGLKAAPDSADVIVAPQGSAGLVYFAPEVDAARVSAVAAFLRGQPWLGQLHAGDELDTLGQRPEAGLRLAFGMWNSDAPSAEGAPGLTDVVAREPDAASPAGFGTHGGLGSAETRPFLIVEGGGFGAGRRVAARTSLPAIAATARRHLGLDTDSLEGLPLPPG